MFSRLKQKVKEKAGVLKATAYPDDVIESVDYYKALQPRMKSLISGLTEVYDIYKIQKKADLQIPLENLKSVSGGKFDVGPLMEAVDKRQKLDAETLTALTAEVEKFKTYLANDIKNQQQATQNLNKCRLDMDAAAGNYASKETEVNKMKAETTMKEYEAAIQRIRDMAKSITEDEKKQGEWLDLYMKCVRNAFK